MDQAEIKLEIKKIRHISHVVTENSIHVSMRQTLKKLLPSTTARKFMKIDLCACHRMFDNTFVFFKVLPELKK